MFHARGLTGLSVADLESAQLTASTNIRRVSAWASRSGSRLQRNPLSFALGFLGVIVAYISGPKPWMRTALLVPAVPLAVLVNAVRVAGPRFRERPRRGGRTNNIEGMRPRKRLYRVSSGPKAALYPHAVPVCHLPPLARQVTSSRVCRLHACRKRNS